MRKAIVFITVISSLFAAGCATNPQEEQRRASKLMEYKIQVYGPACEKLGFARDTDAWRECVQREYEQTIMRQQQYWSDPYYSPYYWRPYYPYYRR